MARDEDKSIIRSSSSDIIETDAKRKSLRFGSSGGGGGGGGGRGRGGGETGMVAMDTPVNHYQQQPQYQAPQASRRWHARLAQKLERWIFLYNVTTGLYMLDWWERCIFNAVFLLFLVVACYNSHHYLQRIGAGLLAWAWWGDSGNRGQEGSLVGGGGSSGTGG